MGAAEKREEGVTDDVRPTRSQRAPKKGADEAGGEATGEATGEAGAEAPAETKTEAPAASAEVVTEPAPADGAGESEQPAS